METQALPPVPTAGPRHSFTDRLIGSVKLSRPIFDEVSKDSRATWQALAVVIAAGISAMVGFQLLENTRSQTGDRSTFDSMLNLVDVPAFVPFPFISTILFWLLVSVLSKNLAGKLMGNVGHIEHWQDIARPLGFATAPACLALMAPVPIIGPLVLVGSWFWVWAAQAVALSTVFHVSKMQGTILLFATLLTAGLMIGLLGVGCLVILMAIVFMTLSFQSPL